MVNSLRGTSSSDWLGSPGSTMLGRRAGLLWDLNRKDMGFGGLLKRLAASLGSRPLLYFLLHLLVACTPWHSRLLEVDERAENHCIKTTQQQQSRKRGRLSLTNTF